MLRSLLLTVLFTSITFAQPPQVTWAVRAGGMKNDKTRGLCVDEAGNVYMTGEFTGEADFGDKKLVSRGDMDFFVAKYDAGGKCIWARQGGGSKTDRGYGVAVDHGGNVFVTGHYQSPDAEFDGVKLASPGKDERDYDVFTAKYDREGKLLWLRTGGGAGYDYGHGVGVDTAGNCYVTAGVVGAAKFDGRNFEHANSRAVVIKYAPDGKLVWLTQPEAKGSSSAGSIAVDAAGNSWICGGYSGEVDYGHGAKLNSPGQRNIFIVKINPDGQAQWAATSTGKTDGGAAAIGVDSAGRAYICGMLKGQTTIGSDSFASVDNHDIFVAAVDAKGQWLWAKHAGGPDIDYALGLAADPAGGCYFTGEFTKTCDFFGVKKLTPYAEPGAKRTDRDLYLAQIKADGSVGSVEQHGGAGGDYCYCVALHEKSNTLYLSGAFNGTTKYGKTELKAIGGNDIMLIQLKR
jgi:hypothetical protein